MATDPTRLRPVSPDDDLTPEELDARERQPMRLQPVAPTGDSGRLPRVSDTEAPSAPFSSTPPRAGSAADAQARLERIQGEKRPWSELGTGGKIGRVFSTIGNVAGDIVAPATMRLIPGTDLNRGAREEQAREELNTAEKQEETTRHNKAEEEVGQGRNAATVEAGQAKTKQAEQKELDALAEHGLTRDEQGNITPLPKEKLSEPARQKLEDSEKLNNLRKAQTDLAEANEELKRAQNDPNSPQFQMAMKKFQMAQLAHEIAAKNLGLHEEEFQNKVHEQDLLKPSGQAQSRASAAQSVLDVMPDLQTLVTRNREKMGPLLGRVYRGEIKIGDVPPEMARLYSAMKSFYALQPAVHGFRNAEFVKDFETALGTLERNPDAFLAGMQGLAPTLKSVAKEGRTFHKRIVEGEGENGGAAAPPNAGESDFANFMNERKTKKPQ